MYSLCSNSYLSLEGNGFNLSLKFSFVSDDFLMTFNELITGVSVLEKSNKFKLSESKVVSSISSLLMVSSLLIVVF